ncbi:hypothetical protein HYC85_006816 [Camellia sinensis]|uniref:GRF-type domain-containing protein n=1 Tax=Camellia sinensis TaxID=4442 RepID=A0A7J7HM87_CAMSI|nr:hypothetical protein HYC85_006816 [Camellia sinensis]
MASSSTNNRIIILKPRLCNCGRTASMHIVRTNENGNEGCVFFVCPTKYSTNEHCNYFRFADDDDDDVTSTIRANAGPRTDPRTEEINDLRKRLGEVDNAVHEHDRRLQRMEKILKAMTYVISYKRATKEARKERANLVLQISKPWSGVGACFPIPSSFHPPPSSSSSSTFSAAKNRSLTGYHHRDHQGGRYSVTCLISGQRHTERTHQAKICRRHVVVDRQRSGEIAWETSNHAHFVFHASANMVGNLMVSRDVAGPESEMGLEFLSAMMEILKLIHEPNMADLFPWFRWLDPQGLRRKMDHELGKILAIISGFVKERMKERREGGERRKELLEVLLDFEGTGGKDEPDKLSEHQISGVIVVINYIYIHICDNRAQRN